MTKLIMISEAISDFTQEFLEEIHCLFSIGINLAVDMLKYLINVTII